VVLWQGRPLVWFDRRSHHLVTFPDTLDAFGGPAWAEALAARVVAGRARSVEVRKVDGEPLEPRSPVARLLHGAGFVDSYRGVVFRAG
jgi:ATP-dependent Lhr-like helicase